MSGINMALFLFCLVRPFEFLNSIEWNLEVLGSALKVCRVMRCMKHLLQVPSICWACHSVKIPSTQVSCSSDCLAAPFNFFSSDLTELVLENRYKNWIKEDNLREVVILVIQLILFQQFQLQQQKSSQSSWRRFINKSVSKSTNWLSATKQMLMFIEEMSSLKLDLNNISVRPCKKLDWLRAGPYKIIEVINPVTFRSNTPKGIHSLFYPVY